MPADVKLIDINKLDRNNDKIIDKLTIQVSTMPIPSATYAGKTVQFVGSSAQYDTGRFYKCVNNGNDNYIWTTVAVESKEIKYTQYETLPTAAQSNVNQIVQYIGDTTNDYKNGYFYKCTGHHTDPNGTIAIVNGVEQFDSFTWEPVDVQGVPIWTGTRAEHTAAETAGTLPDNSLIGITDETPSGGSGSGGSGGAAIDDTTVSTTSTWSSQKINELITSSPVQTSFEYASDDMLASMLEQADNGDIDISDYWAVGDERKVKLSAMERLTNNNVPAQAEQWVVYIIMHMGLYKDANDNDVHCVVGIRDILSSSGGLRNITNNNTGSWNGCDFRTWANSNYYNAHQSGFKSLLKQFKTITASTYNGSTNQTSLDYVALFAVKEVLGSAGSGNNNSNSTEADALTQMAYYKISANRIKKSRITGAAYAWWTRSPAAADMYSFCNILETGDLSTYGPMNSRGYSPFVCI